MLRNFLVVLSLILTSTLHSQITIKGKVLDETGAPLPGADIYFQKSLQGTISAPDGSFLLIKHAYSHDSLIVAYLGYDRQAFAIDSARMMDVKVSLKPKHFLGDEILVFGSRAGNTTPIAFTNLNREELERVNTGSDLTYMLSHTPSFVAISEAGTGIGNTAMRIRGSDPTRINVTINGIPLNDPESQAVFWVNLPDLGSSVDNVQIQRGVGTSTQGAAAFGATVNFQTGDLNDKPYAEYGLLAGSFNTFRHTLEAGSGLIARHFTIDARVSKLNSDGYINHSFTDQSSLYLTSAFHARKSLIRFTYMHGNERTGISWWGVPAEVVDTARRYNPAGVYFDRNGVEHFYDNQTDNYRQNHYQLHAAHALTPKIKLNLAGFYVRGSGYYEQYEDDDNSYHTTDFLSYGLDTIFSGPDTITQSDMAIQKHMKNYFFGFTTAAHFKMMNYEITAGAGWNRYNGDHFGKLLWMEQESDVPSNYEWYRNSGLKTDWNLYAKANYLLSPEITLFADMQFRHIQYILSGNDDDLVGLDQEHRFNFFNPKAGAYYSFNANHKVYASFAVAHREPARSDFKEAKGDPGAAPRPERLYDLEIGYDYSLDFISVGINLYNMQYKDQLIPTGEKSDVGYDIMTNVSRSYRRGIEIEAAYLPFDFLKWNVNMTLSSNKIRDYVEYATHYTNWDEVTGWYTDEEYIATPLGTTNIAYSPSVLWTSTIDYEFYPKAHVSLISRFVGKQYFDNTSSDDRSLKPYFLNDLKAEYEFSYKFLKKVSVMVQLCNLFNVKYINNAYGGNWYEGGDEKTWAYYYPQAGIHIFSGIKIRF